MNPEQLDRILCYLGENITDKAVPFLDVHHGPDKSLRSALAFDYRDAVAVTDCIVANHYGLTVEYIGDGVCIAKANVID